MHPITYAQALLAILLWATLAWLGVALSAMPPFLLVGLALLLGAVCGLPFIRQWRVPVSTVLFGIYGLFGFHFFLFMALRFAPPVEANLINYLWPLLIVLLTPLLLSGYRLRTQHVVGAGMGFAGAALIVTGGSWTLSGDYWLGYAFAAASAFIWASYSVLTKRIAPFPTAAIGLFCLLSGLLALGLHTLLEPPYVPSPQEWRLLALLGLGPMGLAFFLWDASLKAGDPRVIGSLAYLTPLLSTLILLIAGSGRMTAAAGVAMVLIVGGAVLGSWRKGAMENAAAVAEGGSGLPPARE